jgi:type II secretory pathway component PulC
MTWSNKRTIVILFIGFIGIVFSIKTARALESTAPGVSPGANKIEYKSEDLGDPFQEEKIEIKEEPEVQTEAMPLPSLQIQGIVWGGGFPQAIINNKVVRAGDAIEGARIADINKSGVTVFFENRQYNLSTSSPIGSQGLNNKNP